MTFGEGAGFIKGDGINFINFFKNFAGFYNNAVFRGLADGGHDGGGGGEDEGARAEYNQNGNTANEAVGEEKGEKGGEEGEGNDEACPFVGGALDGGLSIFGAFN